MRRPIRDGYVSIDAENCTPENLFELASDMLGRLEDMEFAFASLTLITLHHLDYISDPEQAPRETIRETLATLHSWLMHYQQHQARIELDKHFMESPE